MKRKNDDGTEVLLKGIEDIVFYLESRTTWTISDVLIHSYTSQIVTKIPAQSGDGNTSLRVRLLRLGTRLPEKEKKGSLENDEFRTQRPRFSNSKHSF